MRAIDWAVSAVIVATYGYSESNEVVSAITMILSLCMSTWALYLGLVRGE